MNPNHALEITRTSLHPSTPPRVLHRFLQLPFFKHIHDKIPGQARIGEPAIIQPRQRGRPLAVPQSAFLRLQVRREQELHRVEPVLVGEVVVVLLEVLLGVVRGVDGVPDGELEGFFEFGFVAVGGVVPVAEAELHGRVGVRDVVVE